MNPSSTRTAADQGGGVHRGSNIPETRADLLIRGLWEIHTDAIINVVFADADSEIYVKEVMDIVLPR